MAVVSLELLLKGVIIGFVVAAPVGPVGVLCIRRAVRDGHVAALLAGLGAAVADTLFGAVAAFGLTLVSDFFATHQTPLRLAGGVFLVVLGIRTLRVRPRTLMAPGDVNGLVEDFFSTFFITLLNPATILAFVGIFAALGAVGTVDRAGWLVVGVFAGSSLWWLTLGLVADASRHRFNLRWMVRLNQVSGVTLIVFGVGVLALLMAARDRL